MQFLKLSRRLNTRGSLKNVSIFLLVNCFFNYENKALVLFFLCLRQKYFKEPKKRCPCGCWWGCHGQARLWSTDLGFPPEPRDRMTCKGPPRPGAKTVNLLTYTSLDFPKQGGGVQTKPLFREKQFKVIHHDTYFFKILFLRKTFRVVNFLKPYNLDSLWLFTPRINNIYILKQVITFKLWK